MSKLSIVPQKIKFEKPSIINGQGQIKSYGMSVSMDIDAFNADKLQIKKDLASIFAEVLEYFD